MCTTRRAARARCSSCVTTMIVVPSRLTCAEQLDHLGAGLRVELTGRLVGEQSARLVRQRARDRHALLLAARQLRRPMRRAARRARRTPAARARASPARAARHLRLGHRQLDVLDRRQRRHQIEALKDETDVQQPKARRRRVAHLIDARRRRSSPCPRVGRSMPPIEIEQRRLAAAGRADDRDVVAARDLERHAAHGAHELVAHVILALADRAPTTTGVRSSDRLLAQRRSRSAATRRATTDRRRPECPRRRASRAPSTRRAARTEEVDRRRKSRETTRESS